MKKHMIIIINLLLAGIFITCMTCTYFDPWQAGGIEGVEMFWADWYGTIWQSHLSEPYSNTEIYSPGPDEAIDAMITDPTTRKIYWSHPAPDVAPEVNKIHRANFDGSEVQEIYFNNHPIDSLAIDPWNGDLYFSENFSIYMIPADGDGNKAEVYSTGSTILDIALDLEHRWIYFTTGGPLLFRLKMPPDPPGTPDYLDLSVVITSIQRVSYDRIKNWVIFTDSDRIFRLEEWMITQYFEIINPPNYVYDVIADPIKEQVYWLEDGSTPPPPDAIFRIPTSGGIVENFINLPPDNDFYEFAIAFMP